jgi:hypothetical protein
MARQEKEYLEQKKRYRKRKPNLTLVEGNYDIELDEEIQELLDGLE